MSREWDSPGRGCFTDGCQTGDITSTLRGMYVVLRYALYRVLVFVAVAYSLWWLHLGPKLFWVLVLIISAVITWFGLRTSRNDLALWLVTRQRGRAD